MLSVSSDYLLSVLLGISALEGLGMLELAGSTGPKSAEMAFTGPDGVLQCRTDLEKKLLLGDRQAWLGKGGAQGANKELLEIQDNRKSPHIIFGYLTLQRSIWHIPH